MDTIKFKEMISDELVDNTNAKPIPDDKRFYLRPLLSVPLSKEDRFAAYIKSVREKTEASLLRVIGKITYPQEEILQEAITLYLVFYIQRQEEE